MVWRETRSPGSGGTMARSEGRLEHSRGPIHSWAEVCDIVSCGGSRDAVEDVCHDDRHRRAWMGRYAHLSWILIWRFLADRAGTVRIVVDQRHPVRRRSGFSLLHRVPRITESGPGPTL